MSGDQPCPIPFGRTRQPLAWAQLAMVTTSAEVFGAAVQTLCTATSPDQFWYACW